MDNGGVLRDELLAGEILQQTCYQCHPGRRTDCLRGAMANGGMLCQDCHGDMAQVRVLKCDDATAFCPDGDSVLFPHDHEVGCTECHENEL